METQRMTVREARDKGLLKIGARIRTNATCVTALVGTIDSIDRERVRGFIRSERHNIWGFDLNSIDWIEFLDTDTDTDTKVIKMEAKDLTQFKKDNLQEAKKQYDEEHKNEEIEQAKAEISTATNQLNRIDRDIKDLQEEKKPYLKILKLVS